MAAPSSPATLREPPGWYGKVMALGDFARRRLPDDFVGICDAWLSEAMTGSRAQLGDGWLDTYLTAPVLRFAWAPGVVDASWWFGVLMPSCDQVGRYFPLLVAQRRARPPLDRIAFEHLSVWFDQMAHAAMETLHETAALAEFEDALADALPWPTPGDVAPLTPSAASGGGISYAVPARTTIHEALQALTTQDLQARVAGCSVWWRQTDDSQPSALSLYRGLPDGTGFAALIAGRT